MKAVTSKTSNKIINIAATRSYRNPVQRPRIRQAGMSLTEMIISVAATVAFLAFAFWMKTVLWGPLQGLMEASAISSQMQKIEGIYSGAANFSGLTTASMATPSVFASKYLPGGGVINNRFGGSVTLGVTTINTASDTQQFTDGGVRSDACPTLVNQLAEDSDRITVGGTIVKALNGTLNAGTLKTQCDSGNVVAVLFERIKRS